MGRTGIHSFSLEWWVKLYVILFSLFLVGNQSNWMTKDFEFQIVEEATENHSAIFSKKSFKFTDNKKRGIFGDSWSSWRKIHFEKIEVWEGRISENRFSYAVLPEFISVYSPIFYCFFLNSSTFLFWDFLTFWSILIFQILT